MRLRRFLKPAPMLVAGILALTLAVAAGCGSSSSSSSSSTTTSAPAASSTTGTKGATATVTIKGFAFAPHVLTVTAGTTVTWTNNDTVPHNVISANGIGVNAATTSTFVSSTMNPGGTFSYTFSKPGTYFYVCTIHKAIPAMHAEVIVH
jgi:plastocyanin